MIKTYAMMIESLSDYLAPANKLRRMVEQGEIIKLTKGLYETDKNISGYLMANIIYGPSYLSFDYALAYHGLIPETVYTYTSATFKKKKKKLYKNILGTFMYRDVPEDVYPYEIVTIQEGEYCYFIASAEKALCDKLYTLKPVKNKKELINLLFDDLRIDQEEFMKLDGGIINNLCDLYHNTNLNLLKKVKGDRDENNNSTNDRRL